MIFPVIRRHVLWLKTAKDAQSSRSAGVNFPLYGSSGTAVVVGLQTGDIMSMLSSATVLTEEQLTDWN